MGNFTCFQSRSQEVGLVGRPPKSGQVRFLRSRDAKFYLQNAKFGNLILRKIIEFVATECQILRLKYTKFNFGWSSAPDPAEEAYSVSPDPIAGFRGPTSK